MKHTEIKTFEDACTKLGLDAAKVLPDFSMFPEHHQKAMTAHAKLVIIAEALNDGWQPNWGDWDEWKYYVWNKFKEGSDKSSGVGFSYFVWAYSSSVTSVGSRLCYQSSEIAAYAGQQFEELYKEYFVIL